MKIILKSFVNEDKEKEHWIIVIERGKNKAVKVDEKTYHAIAEFNRVISN